MTVLLAFVVAVLAGASVLVLRTAGLSWPLHPGADVEDLTPPVLKVAARARGPPTPGTVWSTEARRQPVPEPHPPTP